MEELIFFAVIILFSIIESISRSRKKRAGRVPELPEDWDDEAPEPEWRAGTSYEAPTSTSSYDEDPSHDELEVERATSTETQPTPRSGSEGMIPSDVWEEIVGLAQGRMRQLERKEERPRPARTTPARTAPARATASRAAARTHRVHLAHKDYGTDPSSRPRSTLDGLDPLARFLSADAAAVRRQLRRGGRHALRRAVILQEILGPPASMRPESFLE